ncbi:hypothetical protein [Streptomyces sp. NPDC002209]|uniref:hypothetical protein n=1 Tax=Streptomyces sp. NPDC002209 TaxID=3364638 RepID=UPI0036B63998
MVYLERVQLNMFKGGVVVTECQGVPARQLRWAVAGVVVAGILGVFGLVVAPFLAHFLFLSAAAAALPLVVRDWPKVFSGACLVVGVGLLAWAVIGAAIGMFVFIPVALLLLVAAFADGGVRPGA